MGQEIEKLSSVKLAALAKAQHGGMHNDGGGLYFRIDPRHGGASWIFRYRDRATGKLRDKGLGPYPSIGLKDARTEAKKHRTQIERGGDPIRNERARRDALRSNTQPVTFGDCATAYIEAHSNSWRNEKHKGQWAATLHTYAKPLIGMPVSAVTKADVLKCLEAGGFWVAKTETATRVRQRIETVIDYAKARDLFIGENPARWRGNLKELLPAPGKLKAVEHHPALPYADMAAFMKILTDKGALTAKGALSVKSLALTILTASRISEVVNAQWQEFDLKASLWRVPKERMKAGREHVVPLSPQAKAILEALHPQESGAVFPNGAGRDGKAKSITDAAPRKTCKEIDPDITVHGFRSTFRDWAADMTAYPREVAEAALAHTLSDKTEAAYRRSDLLNKRMLLMTEWATYCYADKPKAGTVTAIRRAKAVSTK